MVNQVSAPKSFTTVIYTTKDGENISATKNNGIVTLVGDKNGTRQMELEDFKNELLNNCAEIKLENSPAKDTVEITKHPETVQKEEAKQPAQPDIQETPKAETGKKLDVAA